MRIIDGRSAAIRTHGGDGIIATTGWTGLRALRVVLGRGPVPHSRVDSIVRWLKWCDSDGEWDTDWSAEEACDIIVSLLDGGLSDSSEWQWREYGFGM